MQVRLGQEELSNRSCTAECQLVFSTLTFTFANQELGVVTLYIQTQPTGEEPRRREVE